MYHSYACKKNICTIQISYSTFTIPKALKSTYSSEARSPVFFQKSIS